MTTSPISFSLGQRGERFLFFDAFIKGMGSPSSLLPEGGRLILVSTYYPDVMFDFSEVEVTLDGLRLERFEEIGYNELEPSRAIIYPLTDVPPRGRHELVVRYRGESTTRSIAPDADPDRRRFAVATLFKDDFGNLETFYRYHKRQGFERFYFFYNGPLANVRRHLPEADDIVYGEWDFAYWLDSTSVAFRSGLVDFQARRNTHHAQAAFLTLVRHRFLADCSFLALIDLDEFLAVEQDTVRTFVERTDAISLTARSHWTEVRRFEHLLPAAVWRMRDFRRLLSLSHRLRHLWQARVHAQVKARPLPLADLGRVWANVRSEGKERPKTIYRHDYPGNFRIHTPRVRGDIRYSEDLKLYHLINAAHARYSRIHPDARPLSLLAGRPHEVSRSE